MTQLSPSASPPRAPQLSPYAALWGILAMGALVYIGWLAANSSLLAEGRTKPTTSVGETNKGQRATSDTLAELKLLKESVSEVQRDMARLRTEVTNAGEQFTALHTRVASLEAPPADDKSAEALPDPAPVPTKPSKSAPAKLAAAKPKAAPALPKVIKAGAAAKAVETGSVATAALAANAASAPVVFGPAMVKRAASPVGIQIATGPSVDSLRLSWSLLNDRHADTLRNLQPRYVAQPGVDGIAYELVAGPLNSDADAQRACALMEAQNVRCKVGVYQGNPF